jgi:hypothetical protein
MKGKEALKIIEQRLKEGHSNGEIFSELTGKVKFRTDLLQLLAMVPEEPLRKKYRNLNILLFTLIVLVGTVKIVIAFFALLSLSIYMVSFEIPIALVSAFFAYMVSITCQSDRNFLPVHQLLTSVCGYFVEWHMSGQATPHRNMDMKG